MAVQIKFDQAGAPAGVAGQAREDFVLGTPVTATAVGGPFLRYQWSIVSKPLNLDAGHRSAAALSAPTASVTQITPIDESDTYLIEVSVDSGYGLGARPEDIARLTFYAGPTLATYPGDLPGRVPATGERDEHNAGGNAEGWAATLRRWLRVLRAVGEARAWALARIVTDPILGPQVVRGVNVANATFNSGTGVYTVTFTRAMADASYGILVTPVFNSSYTAVTIPRVESVSAGSFTLAFYQVDGTTKIRQSFTLAAFLRA